MYPTYDCEEQELKLYTKDCERKKKLLMSIFDDKGEVDTYELFMLINECSEASIERSLSSFIKNVERSALPIPQLYAKWFWSHADGDGDQQTDGASHHASSPDMYSFRLEANTRGVGASGSRGARNPPPGDLKKAIEELLPLVDDHTNVNGHNRVNSGGNVDNANKNEKKHDGDGEQPLSPSRNRSKGGKSKTNNIRAALDDEIEDIDNDEEGSTPAVQNNNSKRIGKSAADAVVGSLLRTTSILNKASERNDPLEEAVAASKQVTSIAATVASSSAPRRSKRRTEIPVMEMTDVEKFETWSAFMFTKWRISEPTLKKSISVARAKNVWKKMDHNARHTSANEAIREAAEEMAKRKAAIRETKEREAASKKESPGQEEEDEDEEQETDNIKTISSSSSSRSSSSSSSSAHRISSSTVQEDEKMKAKSPVKRTRSVDKSKAMNEIVDTGRPSRVKRPVKKFNPVLPAGAKKYEEDDGNDMTIYAQQVNLPSSHEFIPEIMLRRSSSKPAATSSSAPAPAPVRKQLPPRRVADNKDKIDHLKYLDESDSSSDDDSGFAPTQPQIPESRSSSSKNKNKNKGGDDNEDNASTKKKKKELAPTRKALFKRNSGQGERLNFSDEEDNNDQRSAVNSLLGLKNTSKRQRTTTPNRVNVNIQSSALSSTSSASKRRAYANKSQQRRKWTDRAIDNFIRAIRDHGAGNWLAIREDRRYNAEYCDRTTVQLKDKYRTLCQQGRF